MLPLHGKLPQDIPEGTDLISVYKRVRRQKQRNAESHHHFQIPKNSPSLQKRPCEEQRPYEEKRTII